MSDKATRRTEWFLEAINNGDLAAIDETRTPDVVMHVPPQPDTVGLQGMRDFVDAARHTLPDAKMPAPPRRQSSGTPPRAISP